MIMNFKFYDPLANYNRFSNKFDKLYDKYYKLGPEFGVYTIYNRHLFNDSKKKIKNKEFKII